MSLLLGKSVVSEPKNKVQTAEARRRGLRVTAEEEGDASHQPLETGDQTGESGGNRRHFGRLNNRREKNTLNLGQAAS